jgi:ferredoxin
MEQQYLVKCSKCGRCLDAVYFEAYTYTWNDGVSYSGTRRKCVLCIQYPTCPNEYLTPSRMERIRVLANARAILVRTHLKEIPPSALESLAVAVDGDGALNPLLVMLSSLFLHHGSIETVIEKLGLDKDACLSVNIRELFRYDASYQGHLRWMSAYGITDDVEALNLRKLSRHLYVKFGITEYPIYTAEGDWSAGPGCDISRMVWQVYEWLWDRYVGLLELERRKKHQPHLRSVVDKCTREKLPLDVCNHIAQFLPVTPHDVSIPQKYLTAMGWDGMPARKLARACRA